MGYRAVSPQPPGRRGENRNWLRWLDLLHRNPLPIVYCRSPRIMMNAEIWAASSSWLHPLPQDVRLVAYEAFPPSGVTFVGRLNAENMSDADEVFLQFSNEFKLPAYFGWNWPALSECLRDLSWITADRFLVVVENSGKLLSASPEERSTLLRTLSRVAKSWAEPLGKSSGEGIPFNVVFLCAEHELEAAQIEAMVFNG